VSPYLPHLLDILAVLVTWTVGGVLFLAGAGLFGRGAAPEFQIAAGWGAFCLLLTGWGVFLPWSLRIPAIAFSIAALCVLLLPTRRPRAGDWAQLGRMLVITLPLWLILAPIRPSQPDTFLNLLPNTFYLVDYGRLPAADLPPSGSLLPAAPYNTQFLSFLGSLVAPDYPAAGMSLVNLMLQLTAALAIARALGTRDASPAPAPGWGLTAAGFLLVTLLNPGFVPRIHLAAYGEPALSALGVLAAWLFVTALSKLAAGRHPTQLFPLALTLAAIVNVKQTGFGLVAALSGAALITVWAERRALLAPAVRFTVVAVVPAVVLYAIWRYHVANAGVDELRPLPFVEWNWAQLSTTTASALEVVSEKPFYFGCVAAGALLLAILLPSQGWTLTSRLLTFSSALFVLYNLFIFATYIVAFPSEMSIEAHSFFRYNTHLSLVLVLALALAVRDLAAAVLPRAERVGMASSLVVLVALLAPIAFVKRLRFDLDMPQPLVWDLAKNLSQRLRDGDRVALLLPGDNDSVATMLSGVLAYTPPRRRMLDLLRRDTADPTTLDEATRLGYSLALISCTPKMWGDLPPAEAVLLNHDNDGWHVAAAWPYPADAAKQRWQHILSWGPLCRVQ
jgi:hypothetical protein